MTVCLEAFSRRSFRKCRTHFRAEGRAWNHKRQWRVYRALGLNLRRNTKRRLPNRERIPMTLSLGPDEVWSADFMADALCCGVRFRKYNVLDDVNREQTNPKQTQTNRTPILNTC